MRKNNIILNNDEIASLQNIINDENSSDRERQRAEILLLSDSNDSQYLTVSEIAEKLKVSRTTVQSVRDDYAAIGIDAIKRKKRGTIRVCTKRPSSIEGAIIEYIDAHKQNHPTEICTVDKIRKELQSKGFIRGISQASIYRVLAHNNIKMADVNSKANAEKPLLTLIKKLLGSRTSDFNKIINNQKKLNSICTRILNSKAFIANVYIHDIPLSRMIQCKNLIDIKIDRETQTIKYLLHHEYNKNSRVICSNCGKVVYASDVSDMGCVNINIFKNLRTKNGLKIWDIPGLVPQYILYINAVAPYKCPKCRHQKAIGFFFQ